MALTKADMAESLFNELGLNKREARELVDVLFEDLRAALVSGEQVKLSGFGNFDLRDKNQRPGRNPKTGEEIPITARRVVTFRPGQKLKARVEAYAGTGENNDELPPIPGKRYFTIGEVSDLCAVKPHVLRYWEQEFPQLKPVKRRGNRRYYQRQDVIVIRQIRSLLYDRQIRSLLYDDGFTIGGARQKLTGEEAKSDLSQSQQIIKQMRKELDEILKLLRR
jgi:integration host factor alpha subunit